MAIKAIACMDLNRSIGYNNELLCRLPSDMARFKKLTIGQGKNTVLCGSKTYDSMGKLDQRDMVVATRNKGKYKGQDVHETDNIHEFIRRWKSYALGGDLFIAGGSETYEQTLQYVDLLYLTVIHHEFPQFDSQFPQLNGEEWEILYIDKHYKDDTHDYDYAYWTLKRVRN